jgi:hypothetical protein
MLSALVVSASAALTSSLLAPHYAQAETRTSDLIEQLKTSDDFRLRTQAALALGASGDNSAVKPLCNALADSNLSVKVAAAAALGKLGKSAGLPCLKAASSREHASSAKSQIDKSIAALEGGSSAAPPPPGPNAKYYVAVDITNKTGRPTAEIDALVRATAQGRILAKSAFAMAPKGEATSQGGQIIKAKKLKGFLLMVTVEPPQYEQGNLTQVVRVSMWTYPGKMLQGEFSPKLTQTSTPKGDIQSENMLVKLCVENAVDTFQKVAASM